MKIDKFKCEKCGHINDITIDQALIGYVMTTPWGDGLEIGKIAYYWCKECGVHNYLPYLGFIAKEVKEDKDDT